MIGNFTVLLACGALAVSAQMCPGIGGSLMTDDARKAFVDEHNKLKSQGVRGLAPDKLGGNAPKGSSSMKYQWDCSIEANAWKWIQTCQEVHSSQQFRTLNGEYVGENMFMSSADIDAKTAAVQATNGFFAELAQNGVGQANIFTQDVANRGTLHYTQLAWGKSYKLGCAINTCPGASWRTWVVCQYGPGGNWMNEKIYEIGEPCSACPAGTTCSKDEGLCTFGGSGPTPAIISSTLQPAGPTTTYFGQFCPDKTPSTPPVNGYCKGTTAMVASQCCPSAGLTNCADGTNGFFSQPLGTCPSGYSYNEKAGVCCSNPGNTKCIDGTQGTPVPDDGLCPKGYARSGRLCCIIAITKCSDGSLGQTAMNGVCPPGYTAVAGNRCCPNQNCFDNSTSCTAWNANNAFCGSTFYTTDQKKQYCAKTCNLCGAMCSNNGIPLGPPTNGVCATGATLENGICCQTCSDSNTACTSWNQNGFCSSTFYTIEQKKQNCAKTCNLC